MKKNIKQDERAVALKRKIASDTCSLLLAALMISLLFQQFVLDAPFAQYAAEFFCFIGAYTFIIIRNLIAGNSLYGERYSGKKILMISSIVAGLTMITGIINYSRYGDKFVDVRLLPTLAITFICAAAGMFAASSFLYYLNRRRQEKITEELDRQERDID